MVIVAMTSQSTCAFSSRACSRCFKVSFDGDGSLLAGVGATTRRERNGAVGCPDRNSRALSRLSVLLIRVFVMGFEGDRPQRQRLLNHCRLIGDVMTILGTVELV